jgi:protein-tyrosine-phosphatase
MNADLVRRARIHAALGDPIRLGMVEYLTLTDASPGELGSRYGLTTNRLAHHLNVLEDAGVIRRARSEGDARRAYVQLRLDDPQIAAAVSAAWHPDLAGGPAAPRVVFVCTHNSARSQLAAAAWQQLSAVPVASAGTHPAARVHPRAVAVARRHGLRIGQARTTHLDQVATPNDLIVCVCDNAYEELATPDGPAMPSAGRLHWAVPDPARLDTDEAFETAYTQLTGRLHRLAETLTP